MNAKDDILPDVGDALRRPSCNDDVLVLATPEPDIGPENERGRTCDPVPSWVGSNRFV